MPLYIGSQPVTDLKVGAQDVQRLYKGSTLLWGRVTEPPPPSYLSDSFDAGITAWIPQWDAITRSNPIGVVRYRNSLNSRNSLSWQEPGAVANVEALAKVRQITTKRSFGVTARVSGLTGARAGYAFASNGADAFSFVLMNGSAAASAPSGSATPSAVSFVTTVNTWYWMRVSFVLGALYAKIWADGSAEPTGWMAHSPDSSQSANGHVGLLASQSFNDQECDYFAVSLDASTIPLPT
jgi:hypothetical protein